MTSAHDHPGDGGPAGPDEPATPEVPAYLRLLWHGDDREPGQRPGPKRGVDLHEVAAAGIRLADAGGLAAVSMRAVAAELAFTPMALYRYVPGKDELITVMVDEAYGPPPAAAVDAGRDWRARITAWARANEQIMRRHRWILEVALSEPPLTPHQLGWMEQGLAALAGTGLSPQAALSCMLLVDVYVRGQAQLIQDRSAGIDPEEADRVYTAKVAALADPAHFPHLTAALNAGALADDEAGADEFAFGLRTVLDGIAARIGEC